MTPNKALLLVAFLFAFFALQLASADGIARIGYDEESFVEKYDPNVNVSGQIRAGFMLTSDAEKVQLDNMYVYFTQATGKKGEIVCFRLASRDGVYSAKWQFTLVEALKNAILVAIPTKKRGELAHYPANALVAIATLGLDCRDKKRVYLPTSWGLKQHDRDSEEQNMRIYLNSDATETALKVHIKDSAKKNAVVPSSCSKIPSTEQTVAFDTICDFALPQQSTLRIIGVKRENFGNDLDGIRFSFRTDP